MNTTPYRSPLLWLAAASLAFATVTTVPAGAAESKAAVKHGPSLKLKSKGSGPLKDEHCGPNHVPCDSVFERYCTKVLKGTMSGEQGWGGRTCWTPS